MSRRRKMKRLVRQCIFCPIKGRMTEEHIWPKWIRRHVPFDTPAHVRASIEYSGDEENILHAEARRGDPRYRGVHFVCHGCNTRWMSELQNSAKAPLLAMVRGEARVLNEAEQSLVAAWVTMSVMTAEHLFPDAIAIPSAERCGFALRPTPLANWRIWAATTGDSDWKGFHVRGTRSLRFPGIAEPHDGEPNTQATTLLIGKAFFHAFSSPSPAQADGIEMDMAKGELKQIWPPRGPIAWPPPPLNADQAQQLTTAIFEMIDGRFGNVEPRFDPKRLSKFEDTTRTLMPTKLHLGQVEPHAGLLRLPPPGQRLYKIMKAERLIDAVSGQYLHFNRVDRYGDFPGADANDGAQLPADLAANQAAAFSGARAWTLADYYNHARGRTYASCFSLENSDHIWREHANGAARGKVCVVFDFDKLRAHLNGILEANARLLLGDGEHADQIFSVNYGVIDYVDRTSHRANEEYLQNPISYTFIKDKSFQAERELRIALSALGIGRFILRDQSELHFPDSVHVGFDFRSAVGEGVIDEILCGPDTDRAFLHTELNKFGIVGCGTAAPAP